ncbi:flagellar hook-basal body complex protein FliE [Futiania mangrovi]|uniref:Flagellar hook-basal body complex protein FliE n=1 Tax=Futiania mangrovi TaxID=2959716 RepID=A0A9J6PJV1_9PROT|nr:flagellar hook-basal body complex protein FliE [Futiania mangrovii]MCP1336815.1 flagellar hook-basal body complex protein FliE [Futiania mangrovii]
MDFKTLQALGAYATGQAKGIRPQDTGAAPGAAAETGQKAPDFAATLADTANAAVSTLSQAERAAIDGLAGRADPHSVVAALTQAELTLETAAAVRDKVVEAYQDILRMPI